MELTGEDKRELEKLEEGLWKAETRFDNEWMERTLAPDFFEFGRSGRIYRREDSIGIESQHIDARFPLKNFDARLLALGVALVTYTSAVTYNGIEEFGNRSSIWTRTENGWQLRFHQGTPVTD